MIDEQYVISYVLFRANGSHEAKIEVFPELHLMIRRRAILVEEEAILTVSSYNVYLYDDGARVDYNGTDRFEKALWLDKE